MAAKGGICIYWKCHHHHHLDSKGLIWPFKWVLGFVPWSQCGGHFPLALYFGGEFSHCSGQKTIHCKSAKKELKIKSMGTSFTFLIKLEQRFFLIKKCAKVVIFCWKKGQKSPYLDNEFLKVAGNLTTNSTLLANLEANLTHDTCLRRMIASPVHFLDKIETKKTLALPSGAKTFLQCLYMMTHNMVFEHIL
jgi:hypothetical protein